MSEYNKLIKYQKEKLDCVLNSKKFSPSKEKNYKKIVDDILENIKIFFIGYYIWRQNKLRKLIRFFINAIMLSFNI